MNSEAKRSRGFWVLGGAVLGIAVLVLSLMWVRDDGSEDGFFAGGDLSVVLADHISGHVLFSDRLPTGVEFDPVFSSPQRLRTPSAGDYTLELRDASGGVVRSVPFNVRFGNGNRDVPQAFFTLRVPSFPDIASFAVMHSGVEVGVLNRSANTPSVTLSGIAEGQRFWLNDPIDLSWNGSDADGDDLVFRLYYSPNGGYTYSSLSMPTTDTSDSFTASHGSRGLESSSRARIGISVSDGARSSFVESPVFTVGLPVPKVSILTPTADAVLSTEKGFVLEATRYSREDGSSPSFSWSSDMDGDLGTGSYLVISGDKLIAGNHTITVTASDSDNQRETATVDVRITDINILLIANDDIEFMGLEETTQIDVLANDIHIGGNSALTKLAIDRQPNLGTAEVTATQTGKPVIEYTPITGGEDIFTYSICDNQNRCDTAEVTAVSPACTINGTPKNDNLIGTVRDDVICGLGGNDTIDGKAGNDIIYAGYGDDLVYGRTGDDTIYGGPGDDTIQGNAGTDTIYPGPGNNTVLSD